MSPAVGRCLRVWLGKDYGTTLPIGNAKSQQSYFGALNGKTGEVFLQAADKADAATTITFLEGLRQHYLQKKLWVVWDTAFYHTSQAVKHYLQNINRQLPEKDWSLTLIGLAKNAPEQTAVKNQFTGDHPVD